MISRLLTRFLDRVYPEPWSVRKPELDPAELERYILSFISDSGSLGYARSQMIRLVRTLQLTPYGRPDDSILEMGAYLQIAPALATVLGYGAVRGCYLGRPHGIEHKSITSSTGETFTCEVDLFDAERDPFPYPDQSLSTVLCCELLEHLSRDPMHTMVEINRVLRPGGYLLLTTPNICSLRATYAMLGRKQPGFFVYYTRESPELAPERRHSREYTPDEIRQLLADSGFTVEVLETGPYGPFDGAPPPIVPLMLRMLRFPATLRGNAIYALAKKAAPVRDRHPSWLYL